MRTAVLGVDRRHSFYFDHPVDHLPGNLLVASLIDLAGGASGTHDQRLRIHLTFPNFGELDEPVELRCSPAGGGFDVVACQAGQPICQGSLALLPGAGTAGKPVPGNGRPVPAAPELVHRVGANTVMAGELECDGPDEYLSAVLSCDALVPPAGLRQPIEIIEAARQLVMMLGHVVFGHPKDSHVIWIELGTDIPAVTPSDVPLALRWRPGPIGRVRPRATFDLELTDGAATLGTVRFVTHTMSPTAYRKLRSAA